MNTQRECLVKDCVLNVKKARSQKMNEDIIEMQEDYFQKGKEEGYNKALEDVKSKSFSIFCDKWNDLINKMLEKKKMITKFMINDYWLDIGQVDDYEKAQEIYKNHFQAD